MVRWIWRAVSERVVLRTGRAARYDFSYAHPVRAIEASKSLNARYPKLGAISYVSTLQYFVIQFLVSLHWSPPYSLSRNTISDLGNTACAKFNRRRICSPLHSLMNVSFVVLGVAMIAGSALIYCSLKSTRGRALGFSSMVIGGMGAVMVGVFPENSIPALHGIGATLPFLVGNIGVVVLDFALEVPVAMRLFTWLTGTVALLSLIFYASGHFLGLGEGGIERMVAYPQTIWLIVLGTYLLVADDLAVRDSRFA
jgi:hypothetical membrane protein